MNKVLELFQFIARRLIRGQPVMLLVVAESSGSSPGRQGYKMAVAGEGSLCGSIGGGVMEVNLVEQSRAILAQQQPVSAGGQVPLKAQLIEQVHQKNSPDASGMICSGRQIVIRILLTADDLSTIATIIDAVESDSSISLTITPDGIAATTYAADTGFSMQSETGFTYTERLGQQHQLCIIGGGHCSLALSGLMAKLGFRITIFDDRPDLNTIEKNRFAHEIKIIENYENIGDLIERGPDVYVVVMTIGYISDEVAIRSLIHRPFKYLGVLGSRAKMAKLLQTLGNDGVPADLLARIHTPIGLLINSRTPEEIAVSIAAEIISIKNSK